MRSERTTFTKIFRCRHPIPAANSGTIVFVKGLGSMGTVGGRRRYCHGFRRFSGIPLTYPDKWQIPLDDPIADVRQLVSWLTREKGYYTILVFTDT